MDDQELARELAALAAAGFGGAEIQAFDAALDKEAPADELERRRSWGSEEFWGHVEAALAAAVEQELSVALTLGSGWGPRAAGDDPKDSLKALMFAERLVTGPGPVELDLDLPDQPPFYQLAEMAENMGEPLCRWLGDQPKLVQPVALLAAKIIDGERDPNPLVLTDVLSLDPSSLVNLTGEWQADGTVTWDVPDGDWAVLAFFQVPDGEYVSLHAWAEEPWALDYLDSAAVQAALAELVPEAVTEEYGGSSLTEVFVDSFELKNERFFGPDFLTEFETRRGYDLTPWLPAILIPGADNHVFDGAGIPTACPFALGDEDERVRWDFSQTVSDLFIERFVAGVEEQAAGWGGALRIQAYGLAVDVMRAAGAAAVPEAEQLYAGGGDLFLKLISSAGHLYGRNVVSAETAVWAGGAHMTTPAKLYAAANKLFTAGINRLVLHGFPYVKTDGYGETGWHPFCSPFGGTSVYSSFVGEASPLWPHMKTMTDYFARAQAVLRAGAPTADLLVVYPWHGLTAAYARWENTDELLWNGAFPGHKGGARSALFDLVDSILGPMDIGPDGGWLVSLRATLYPFECMGWTWDFVNYHSLREARAVDGAWELRGVRYKAVLLFSLPHLDPEAAAALAEGVASGAPLVSLDQPPARTPGRDVSGEADADLQATMDQLFSQPTARSVTPSEGLMEALCQLGVTPDVSWAEGSSALKVLRRDLGGGAFLVWLFNPMHQTPLAQGLSVTDCQDPILVDLWDLSWFHLDDVGGKISLAPYGSLVLTCGLEPPGGGWTERSPPAGAGTPISGPWSLTVGDQDFVLEELKDWREIPELAWSSEPGDYAATLELASAPTGPVFLELADLSGLAEIRVNGQLAGTALVPPYRVDVSGLLEAGENMLVVRLVPPLKNKLLGLGQGGEPAYAQFNVKDDTRVPVGLFGPVVLHGLEK